MTSSPQPITLTVDVEEFVGAPDAERAETVTNELFDFLDEQSIRVTAFIVGAFAERHPHLVTRIAGAGHEIALHGHEHRVLDTWDQATFAEQTHAAASKLTELAGSAIAGYRAPLFSLTPATPWVPEILSESGFRYSSSVLPSSSVRAHIGYPTAPRSAFRWRCGLVELPCPVYGRVPVGGAFLRLAPGWFADRMVRAASRRTPWLYVHPYDFDAGEPFSVMPGTSWFESRLLFARRKAMYKRVQRALRFGTAPPLAERLDEIVAQNQPTFASV